MRKSFRSPGLKLFVLLVGAITLLIQLAAFTPGPWHVESDLASEECEQCPICRTAGQGMVEAGPTIQLAPPIPTICLNLPEELPGEREFIAHNYFARAPPLLASI